VAQQGAATLSGRFGYPSELDVERRVSARARSRFCAFCEARSGCGLFFCRQIPETFTVARYCRQRIISPWPEEISIEEARLFAEEIFGRTIPPTPPEQAAAHAKREQPQPPGGISTRAEQQLRERQRVEALVRSDRRLLDFLADIKVEYEDLRNSVLGEEAEARATQRGERYADGRPAHEAWDSAKHPRTGAPPNAGWFASTGAAGGGPKSGAAGGETPSGGLPLKPATPKTKTQLPADSRGTWIQGTKGNGTFRYNDSPENQSAGLAGKEVRYVDQHIAVGGFPSDAYYGGSAEAASVPIANVTGTKADAVAADAAMREKLGNPNWKRPSGYKWNHAGPPGSKVMELVHERYHRPVSHKGPAAEPRAARRISRQAPGQKGRGGAADATGRAMGALTVYLAGRDTLRTLGVLQPDFASTGDAEYYFKDSGGSVFIVKPAGWLSGAKREFIAGPRKGQTETITKAEEESYRAEAEKVWGKYIPGTLTRSPRFIPGTKRKTLPVYSDDEHGVRLETGWVDEDGVHYYDEPRPAPA
jgi:hypothetical protein